MHILAILGQKSQFLIKSFGTHVMEKPPRHLVCIVRSNLTYLFHTLGHFGLFGLFLAIAPSAFKIKKEGVPIFQLSFICTLKAIEVIKR